MAWLDMQWNRPSRTDYYLMRIAAMLSGKKVKLEDMKVKFKETDGKPQPGGLTRQQLLEIHKQNRLAMVLRGGPRPPGAK